MIKSDGSVHCAFVFGKSRLAPLKTRSIPRLELMAAVLAVEIYLMLNVEMRISVGRVVFWSDSKVVLCCIRSRTRRFPRFTANRVSSIQQATDPSQWCYVNTKVNPADCATRGTSKLDVWLSAPEFLHETVSEWSSAFDNSIVDESVLDEPVYNELTCCTSEAEDNTSDLPHDDEDGRGAADKIIHYFSSFDKLCRAVAWFHKFDRWRISRDEKVADIEADDIEIAKKSIIRYVQRMTYQTEYELLAAGKRLPKKDPIYYLEPTLDEEGIIRIGGRLQHPDIGDCARRQFLLPRHHHVTLLIVRGLHEKCCLHSGTDYVMAKLREDYWIPRARTVVKGVVRRCKTCIRLSARPSAPRMSDLPPARLAVGRRPFTFVVVDCFGPFLIRRGRSEVKCYGLILTCMTIGAVHLEVLPSLTSDIFIDGLRRFVARRRVLERLFSDNGTNFVGACRELGNALREVNAHLQLRGFMLQIGISLSFNPPAASGSA